MLSRRTFLAASAASPFLARAQSNRKPNIVFILADDLGYGDLGCYGQQRIKTPNIDRLATEGTRFTQAYAGATVCAPSRCALMTGYHTGHTWIRGNANVSLRPEDVTVAQLLQKAGYRTGIVGKWGLADAGDPGVPNLKGFDEWFGYLNQTHAHNYYPEHLWHNNRDVLLKQNWGNQRKTWSHDLMAQHALQFIDDNHDRPFFLYAAFTVPHANNEAVQYADNGLEVPNDAPYTDQPWPQTEKNFAAMVTRLDATVGQIMARLKQHGLDDNTLVIFTSDNGPHAEGKQNPNFFESRGPLRGIKRDLTEGGIRVPFIARWPGKVKSDATSEQVFAFWDMLPTFCELAGTDAPAGIDGISMVNALMSRTQRQHDYLYWEFHEGGFSQAIRTGNWKFIRYGSTGPIEVYNLKTDVHETHNLAAEQPELAARAEKLFAQARTDNPNFPVKNGPANDPELKKKIKASSQY